MVITFCDFQFYHSSLGLDFILNMSLPILSIMCPIAILIVVFGIFKKPKQIKE